MTFRKTRAFLESPAAWGGVPPERVVETHASLVFLTSDRAWKLKKPVRLGHVDLRTLRARAHFCRHELRLNRELAGPVYRGVVALVQDADGALSVGGKGRAVDWLIEMERLPDAQMLNWRLTDGPGPAPGEIDAVCDTLIGFYRSHPVERAGAGYHERLLREAQTNGVHLREMQGHLGRELNSGLIARACARLEGCGDEIVARGEAGLLVEGHGDLRAEHVCLVTPPVIFDRVEFDDAYRILDPWDEFDALGLDCALAGAGWVRAALLARLSKAFARPSPELLLAYGVTWCLTRARLAIDHLRDAEVRTPERWAPLAQRYLDAATLLTERDEGPPMRRGAAQEPPAFEGPR